MRERKTKPKRIFKPFVTETAVGMEPEKFTQFFTMEFRKQEKIKIFPFKLKRTITEVTGVRPLEITTSGRHGFTVKVANKKQSLMMSEVREVNGCECRVGHHRFFNESS